MQIYIFTNRIKKMKSDEEFFILWYSTCSNVIHIVLTILVLNWDSSETDEGFVWNFWIYRVSLKFTSKLILLVNQIKYVKDVRINEIPGNVFIWVTINVGNFFRLQECRLPFVESMIYRNKNNSSKCICFRLRFCTTNV